MRLLTRYILREVSSHALLGGVLFTFVLFMQHLSDILGLAVRNSASLGDVCRIILYMLPNTLTVTIPMAILVGILLGLSRLAADSEITAMRASGMGVLGFVRIVSILAIAGMAAGLVNSIWLAPRSAAALLGLESSLKSSQASFEVQPRVFYEDLKNYVLYVQDVKPALGGASIWKRVFLADLSDPESPHVTTADKAVVVNEPGSANALPGGVEGPTIRLHLLDGTQHQVSATNPGQYDISTFTTTDIPLQTGVQNGTRVSRSDTPIHALSLREVYQLSRVTPKDAKDFSSRPFLIELNSRFSYPFACIVLMLVGVPLGLSSKRSGRSTGIVLAIALVFVYYLTSLVGVAFAKSGKVSPFVGVWSANLIFLVAGVLLLQQLSRGGIALNIFASVGQWLGRVLERMMSRDEDGPGAPERVTMAQRLATFRATLHIRFPLLLDDYVMREFVTNFFFVLSSFAVLFLVFTFFELIGDIIRNRTALVTVGEYLVNLIPYIISAVTPLCALVAVLVTFGALNRTSELTAMKATGISLYRVVAPVLVIAAVLAASLFAFDEYYLPGANRRQEALRAVIKNKPAQTFLRPDRKWISGQTGTAVVPVAAVTGKSGKIVQPGAAVEPARIFYYQFFDSNKDVFANLTVFELEPDTFVLRRRIFASSVRWDGHNWIFDQGWQRTFAGETVGTYQPFTVAEFPEIKEQPSYFKKEDLQSQEMSFAELSDYIGDLRQSGFDTMRLRVQLMKKIAYPVVTLVMAILAVPFALSMGKRGSLVGISTAIGLAISYWVVAGLFEAMGNVNTLPPVLAAWSPDVLFGIAGAYLLLRTPT
jgi:LPS export ABC transporter permease LptG/LPS export ABC transporter permease LptF